MLNLDLVRKSDWHAVHAGPRGPQGAQLPCLVCGQGCAATASHIHLHGGGALIMTEDEAAQLNAQGREPEDMGCSRSGATACADTRSWRRMWSARSPMCYCCGWIGGNGRRGTRSPNGTPGRHDEDERKGRR